MTEVIARDRIDEDAEIETRRYRHGYETRIVGGHFDGDRWYSPDHASALQWHAEMLATYRTPEPEVSP